MEIEAILKELRAERDRLDKAIHALESVAPTNHRPRRGRPRTKAPADNRTEAAQAGAEAGGMDHHEP